MLHSTAPPSRLQRRFDYLKFSLLLILVFNFELDNQTQDQKGTFHRDLRFCEQCFYHQIPNCTKFLQAVEADIGPRTFEGFFNLLPFNNKRSMQFWRMKMASEGQIQILSKSLTQIELQPFEKASKQLDKFKTMFLESKNLEGLQLCPQKNMPRLVEYFKQVTQHCELSIWLHFALDVEPLLMPLLENKGFPVPKTFVTCGFTLFQEYVGRALTHYYGLENFQFKLKMAKELLESVLKFSKGLNGFRIYITDLNADNLIWNDQTERLYFVDLDSIIIVDSENDQLQQQIHKHIYIECEDCFAYSQQDICAHQLSDINIFAACQLLREDLNRDRNAGFLDPIPTDILIKHPSFVQLLDECVDCLGEKCRNRFPVAEELLKLFKLLLNEEV